MMKLTYRNYQDKQRFAKLLSLIFLVLYLGACSRPSAPITTSQVMISSTPTDPVGVDGPADSDQDGVEDLRDECPETPAKVSVDKNGCPLDGDDDGLADYEDPCPTQKGTPCADADGDGIADNQDYCPDTAGPLYNNGCPVPLPANLSDAQKRAALVAQEVAEKDRRRVTVFFCTNRNLLSDKPQLAFGKNPTALRYGTCRVSIPRDHKMGKLELPISLLGFTLEKPNPEKHVVVVTSRLASRGELVGLMNNKIAESARKEAFIFVHGFNNTFEDATLRTAQFAYDLGFTGVPVMFSWPSQGPAINLVDQYRLDEKMNALSVAPFKGFLRHFLQTSKARQVYLIAHSMGNRIMVAALKEMMVQEPQVFLGHTIQEIVLTAPDISAEDFKQDIVPIVKKGATNITLYASNDDIPLKTSMALNLAPRAGQAGQRLLVLPGVETIDASGVASDFLAHSYFASEGTVVGDIHYMLRKKERARQRKWLKPMSGGYWTFKTPREKGL
ncbi:alpha/beta hydrolase [Hymenobacter bucti]|uniref:Alpha/beta hydrolase n=1 Tax=Hymenobacter bucti TaxID=1844114 RepID=A0ABW4QY89_9BACT